MKSTTSLLFASIILTLCSCQNPADNARLGALTGLAISFAESRGKLSPQDAAAIRAAQTIILPPAAVESPPLGKQPTVDLSP